MQQLEEYLTHYDDLSNNHPYEILCQDPNTPDINGNRVIDVIYRLMCEDEGIMPEPRIDPSTIMEVPSGKTWEDCVNEHVYPNLYTYDAHGNAFPDLWTKTLRENLETMTIEDIVAALNKFHMFDREIFKYIYEKGFRDFSSLVFKVPPNVHLQYVDQVLITTKSVEDTYRVYDQSFDISPAYKHRGNFYTRVSDDIVRCKLDIPLTIPDDVIVGMGWIIELADVDTLMTTFKKSVLSSYDNICDVITKKHYACSEFSERIPEIVIKILLKRPKEEITEELYKAYWKPQEEPYSLAYSNTISQHPSVLYARYYFEAPPEWMVVPEHKMAVIKELEAFDIPIPRYLEVSEFKHFVPCKHFFVMGHHVKCWYTNASTECLHCDICVRNIRLPSAKKVNTVVCGRCACIREYLYVYDCGDVICKECYEMYHTPHSLLLFHSCKGE